MESWCQYSFFSGYLKPTVQQQCSLKLYSSLSWKEYTHNTSDQDTQHTDNAKICLQPNP